MTMNSVSPQPCANSLLFKQPSSISYSASKHKKREKQNRKYFFDKCLFYSGALFPAFVIHTQPITKVIAKAIFWHRIIVKIAKILYSHVGNELINYANHFRQVSFFFWYFLRNRTRISEHMWEINNLLTVFFSRAKYQFLHLLLIDKTNKMTGKWDVCFVLVLLLEGFYWLVKCLSRVMMSESWGESFKFYQDALQRRVI